MNLQASPIDAHRSDLPRLEKLNREAFPPQERLETPKLLAMAAEGLVEIWAFRDGEVFVGFAAVMPYGPLGYIWFFAVEHTLRGRGYGSQALALLKELYQGRQLVLDLEELDDSAPNPQQRQARRAFYLRNGYCPTGWFMAYGGATFEVLSQGEPFLLQAFAEMVQAMGVRGFHPRFFQK